MQLGVDGNVRRQRPSHEPAGHKRNPGHWQRACSSDIELFTKKRTAVSPLSSPWPTTPDAVVDLLAQAI